MKLTVQDYRNCLEIIKEMKSSGKGLVTHCNDQIEEMEKPARKQYRCIKNKFPFTGWAVGETHYESTSELEYSEHPFHFEEVIAPVEKAALTVEEIYNELIKIENEGNYCSYKFLALIEEIKITHKI